MKLKIQAILNYIGDTLVEIIGWTLAITPWIAVPFMVENIVWQIGWGLFYFLVVADIWWATFVGRDIKLDGTRRFTQNDRDERARAANEKRRKSFYKN